MPTFKVIIAGIVCAYLWAATTQAILAWHYREFVFLAKCLVALLAASGFAALGWLANWLAVKKLIKRNTDSFLFWVVAHLPIIVLIPLLLSQMQLTVESYVSSGVWDFFDIGNKTLLILPELGACVILGLTLLFSLGQRLLKKAKIFNIGSQKVANKTATGLDHDRVA